MHELTASESMQVQGGDDPVASWPVGPNADQLDAIEAVLDLLADLQQQALLEKVRYTYMILN